MHTRRRWNSPRECNKSMQQNAAPPTCDHSTMQTERERARTLFIKMSYTRAATREHLPGSSPRSGIASHSVLMRYLFCRRHSRPQTRNRRAEMLLLLRSLSVLCTCLAMRYNLKAAERGAWECLSEKINMGVTKPNAQFTELIIPIAQKIERKKRGSKLILRSAMLINIGAPNHEKRRNPIID